DARLHHTTSVPDFGIGEHQGVHYYVMQFIQGQGLDVVLKEVRRLRLHEQTRDDKKSDACRELTISIGHSLLTGHTEQTIGENGTPIPDRINFTPSASPQSCLPNEGSPS